MIEKRNGNVCPIHLPRRIRKIIKFSKNPPDSIPPSRDSHTIQPEAPHCTDSEIIGIRSGLVGPPLPDPRASARTPRGSLIRLFHRDHGRSRRELAFEEGRREWCGRVEERKSLSPFSRVGDSSLLPGIYSSAVPRVAYAAESTPTLPTSCRSLGSENLKRPKQITNVCLSI